MSSQKSQAPKRKSNPKPRKQHPQKEKPKAKETKKPAPKQAKKVNKPREEGVEKETKRGEKRGKNENLTPFSAENQPTPEQKKEGWERKRYAQSIANQVAEYMSMDMETLLDMHQDMKTNPANYTLQQATLLGYAVAGLTNPKMAVDWINRNLPYAPQKTEISGNDGSPIVIEIGKGDD